MDVVLSLLPKMGFIYEKRKKKNAENCGFLWVFFIAE